MRSPMLTIATGMQEIGKSYQSLKQMLYQAYVAKHKRGGLIFDTNGEYGMYEIDGKKHNIKEIGHDEIIKYGNSPKKEVRRIAPFHSNGAPMHPDDLEKLVIKAINQYRGGILLLEDLNKVYGDSLPQSIASLLCNVRHRNCDVLINLQSVGRILPKMRQNTKIIRYHYQLDSIEDSRDKLQGEIQIYKIAEKLVNKQFEDGNRWFFVYIYREIKKIKGIFSPRMFSEAIQDYLSENDREITNLLRKKDIKGKRIYNYEQCVKIKVAELFTKYYGN